MRTKGSCRFEPYFKVEVWNAALQCYKPIQKSYPTLAIAKYWTPANQKFRIIEISESGTKIVVPENHV